MTTYTLTGADGRPYVSAIPGRLGGHRRNKLYGRLDCPSALRALAAGGYRAHRVFFADGSAAIAAGYRPCAVCLSEEYRRWKAVGELRPKACIRPIPAFRDQGALHDSAPAAGPTR